MAWEWEPTHGEATLRDRLLQTTPSPMYAAKRPGLKPRSPGLSRRTLRMAFTSALSPTRVLVACALM